MNILLIGNGFDLAHGLPTTYNDFLTFLEYINSDSSTSSLKINPELEVLIKKDDKAEAIQKIKTLTNNNVWYKYFSVLDNLSPNWCDFEYEIEYVVKQFEGFKKLLEKNHEISLKDLKISINKKNEIISLNYDIFETFAKYYILKKFDITEKEISQILINNQFVLTLGKKFKSSKPTIYWIYNAVAFEDFINMISEELKDFTKSFELYLSYFVNKIEIKPIAFINNLLDDLNLQILSFNYTNTTTKYNKQFKHLPCFIHGQAITDEKDNLVLGINETSNSIDPLFTNFRKYFQRVLKNCNFSYRNWINEINRYNSGKIIKVGSEIHHLYIIGHSLTLSDKNILNELITIKGMKTTIYYRSDKNRKELLQNLAAILGYKAFTELIENKAIIFEKCDFNKTVSVFKYN